MGDRAYTRILVGGPLKRSQIEEFLTASDEDYEGHDQPVSGEVWDLEDEERNGGWFHELEEFCFQNDLTYWRQNGGCAGVFDDGGECWRPGMEHPFGWSELSTGSDFATDIGHLKNCLKAGKTLEQVIADLEGGYFQMEDVPPFEIVEDAD